MTLSSTGKDSAVCVTVVIVSWNTRDLVANCLRSIADSTNLGGQGIQFEVYVVDNASTDGTAELQNDFRWVRFIANEDNVGFARANNQVVESSAGDYVILLNPDTIVNSGALEKLVRFMEDNPGVGATGPKVLNPDGTMQLSCYPNPTLLRELGRLFRLRRLLPDSSYSMGEWSGESPREVDIIQGACLVIRRSAVDDAGVLDEDFFIYSEDFDFCYRLRKHGWRLFWIPTAEVVHFGGQSTSQNSASMFLHLHGAKLLFFRKHYGRYKTALYKVVLAITAISRIISAPILWVKSPDFREESAAMSRNYWRLLWALPTL